MSEDVSISDVVAETAPVEYSKIPYVIELKEYPSDDPELYRQSSDEHCESECDGSGDSVVVDTD
jgi:hypothetical protein